MKNLEGVCLSEHKECTINLGFNVGISTVPEMDVQTDVRQNWDFDDIDSPGADLRIGEMDLPSSGGEGVHVYLLDTGIRSSHEQFTGRAYARTDFTMGELSDVTICDHGGSPRVVFTWDSSEAWEAKDLQSDYPTGAIPDHIGVHSYKKKIKDDATAKGLTVQDLPDRENDCSSKMCCACDCNGHGTHSAAILGGKNGLANQVQLHAMKVTDDDGTGNLAWVLQAINWAMVQGKRPAIISAGIQVPGVSASILHAIEAAASSGVLTIVPAGTSNQDSCNFFPSNVPSVVTVGSLDEQLARSTWSNFGECNDVYVPGERILTAGSRNDTTADLVWGTTMAAARAAGRAAKILALDADVEHPITVHQLKTMLQASNAGQRSYH